MANIIISSKKKISLGLAGGAAQLKVGKNEIDEKVYQSVKDKWFFEALVKSGTVVVEVPAKPTRPSFPLAEIAIGPETLEFIPAAEITESIAPEFPIQYVPPEGVEIKTFQEDFPQAVFPAEIPREVVIPGIAPVAAEVIAEVKLPVKAGKPVTSKMTKAEAPKRAKFKAGK